MFIMPIWFTFLSFFMNMAFGREVGYKGSSMVATFLLSISFIFSLLNLTEMVFFNSFGLLNCFIWFKFGLFYEKALFMFDSLSGIMVSMIILISLLVHNYSVEYLKFDPHFVRFISYLSLFTFFMMFLAYSGNFLIMFIGWEGMGLVSYLLIGFWTTSNYVSQSSVKAFLVNRIGDFGFLFSIIILYNMFKTLNFSLISLMVPFLFKSYFKMVIYNTSFDLIEFMTILLFIASSAKSSQMSLHMWLYSSMEGPTPVSSLIHAATLVCAGIFLLLSTSFFFDLCELSLTFMTMMGCLTTLFAGSSGLLQNDIKSVIAFSTCSQLGFIFIACGLSQFNLAFFHLINHSFFKAVLFLSAGSVMHNTMANQDLSNYGGLAKFFPISFIVMFFASLSLIGFPGVSGFYSKDMLFEVMWTLSLFNYCIMDQSFAFYIMSSTMVFTALYSSSLMILIFLSKPSLSSSNLVQLNESGLKIQITIMSLFFLSLMTGFYFKDIFIGIGSDVFNGVLFYYCVDMNLIESEFTNFMMKMLPLGLSLFSINLGIILVSLKTLYHWKVYRIVVSLINNKWYWDILLYKMMTLCFNTGLWSLMRFIDKGFLEQTSSVLGIFMFNKFGLKNLMNYTGQTVYYLYMIFLVNMTLFVFSILSMNINMLGLISMMLCLNMFKIIN